MWKLLTNWLPPICIQGIRSPLWRVNALLANLAWFGITATGNLLNARTEAMKNFRYRSRPQQYNTETPSQSTLRIFDRQQTCRRYARDTSRSIRTDADAYSEGLLMLLEDSVDGSRPLLTATSLTLSSKRTACASGSPAGVSSFCRLYRQCEDALKSWPRSRQPQCPPRLA